jgi:hypothetical protein
VQDAEKARQRRSRLESILNVAQRLRLRCFHQLRPCWTTFLSILRDDELFDAERLFVWVLGETDEDHVILLSNGPRVHIIGKAPGH